MSVHASILGCDGFALSGVNAIFVNASKGYPTGDICFWHDQVWIAGIHLVAFVEIHLLKVQCHIIIAQCLFGYLFVLQFRTH